MEVDRAETTPLLRIVGRKDDAGAASGELAQDHLNAGGTAAIEAGTRFVEEEDFRLEDEGAGKGDALLLAAGKGAGATFAKVG
jgi:hypothetical protein